MPSPVVASDFDISNLGGNVCEILTKENANNNLWKSWFGWAFTPDGSAVTPEFAAMFSNFLFPIGAVLWWPLASTPANYVKADGRSLLRAHSSVGALDGYPELFAVYGTTFGFEDITHFNVRDIRDRFLLGSGDAHPVGEVDGEEDHLLTEAELPTVTPVVDFAPDIKANFAGYTAFSALSTVESGTNTSPLPYAAAGTARTGLVVLPFGDDAPHNNMPPYCTGTWVIKAR